MSAAEEAASHKTWGLPIQYRAELYNKAETGQCQMSMHWILLRKDDLKTNDISKSGWKPEVE
jgi:hypothetical protein